MKAIFNYLAFAGLFASGGVISDVFAQTMAEASYFEIETIGGGELYSNKVYRDSATQVVYTAGQLRKRLEEAQPFDIIYVDDNAEINLTGQWRFVVKENVILASGRGIKGSLGALLFTSTKEKRDLFQVQSGGRVTGLRIKGPTIVPDGPGMCKNDAIGIVISEAENVEIDNNEIFAWPRGGVGIGYSSNINVHHNHFHHHQRVERSADCDRHYAMGYGVVADTSQNVVIARNLFDHNRHDIASAGSIVDPEGEPVDTEYIARYNLVLGGAIGHNFDVHGGGDRESREDFNAGTYFHMHHNVFTQNSVNGVVIRGIPEIEARINNNEFPHSSELSVILQKSSELLAILQKKCSEDEMDRCDYYKNLVANNNQFNMKYPKRWYVSFSGKSFWRFRKFDGIHPKYLRWGDFNGDGKQDAFKTLNGQWQVALSGLEKWKKWNVSGLTLNNLRFADFNGDGKTDVFRVSRGIWYVSYGGNGKWKYLNRSSVALSSLKFGDFNGDGKDDVFRTNGSSWYVSYSGTGRWLRINNSSASSSSLLLGDFNGDGRTDVFTSTYGQWKVSLNGKSKWVNWNHSDVSLSKLKFGDMNGDSKTDVFFGNGSRWYVSYGGSTSWQPLKHSNIKSTELTLVDVNGDGKADVLSHQSW